MPVSETTRGRIHTGDRGVTFELEVYDTDVTGSNTEPLDLSPQSAMAFMRFQRPDATTAEFPATRVSDGTDGVIRYTSNDSDFFNMAGYWFYGARVEIEGRIHTSNMVAFEVLGGEQ